MVFKSTAEYAAHMQGKIDALIRDDIPFKEAVYNDIARKSIRIYEQGMNSNGSQIGKYSTSPAMYVNPDYAPRSGNIRTKSGGKLQGLKPTVGKTGKSVFKNGKPHKTTYLPGGYKELRNRTGRRIDIVNLRFTNDLFLDWANVATEKQLPVPTKINQHSYVIKLKRAHNADKVEGIEKKYGAVFASTPQERVLFIRDLQARLKVFMES